SRYSSTTGPLTGIMTELLSALVGKLSGGTAKTSRLFQRTLRPRLRMGKNTVSSSALLTYSETMRQQRLHSNFVVRANARATRGPCHPVDDDVARQTPRIKGEGLGGRWLGWGNA